MKKALLMGLFFYVSGSFAMETPELRSGKEKSKKYQIIAALIAFTNLNRQILKTLKDHDIFEYCKDKVGRDDREIICGAFSKTVNGENWGVWYKVNGKPNSRREYFLYEFLKGSFRPQPTQISDNEIEEIDDYLKNLPNEKYEKFLTKLARAINSDDYIKVKFKGSISKPKVKSDFQTKIQTKSIEFNWENKSLFEESAQKSIIKEQRNEYDIFLSLPAPLRDLSAWVIKLKKERLFLAKKKEEKKRKKNEKIFINGHHLRWSDVINS